MAPCFEQETHKASNRTLYLLVTRMDISLSGIQANSGFWLTEKKRLLVLISAVFFLFFFPLGLSGGNTHGSKTHDKWNMNRTADGIWNKEKDCVYFRGNYKKDE